jgi:hypothetical protein
MAERKAFLLRLPADLLDGLQLWARDDLRSLNAQIEYVLRDAMRRRGRSKGEEAAAPPSSDDTPAGLDDAGSADSAPA